MVGGGGGAQGQRWFNKFSHIFLENDWHIIKGAEGREWGWGIMGNLDEGKRRSEGKEKGESRGGWGNMGKLQ